MTILHGDALDILPTLPADSFDAVVTDPPYGLEFMGHGWDRFGSDTAGRMFQDFSQQWAAECLRVLKPGGHLLAFGGSRTAHRLTVGIEDAGFDIRDSITWLYGSGFPKSLDVSKAIDKTAGAAELVEQWQGWGTALKPASEPIIVGRKPLVGTVAANVQRYGTGAMNIAATRVPHASEADRLESTLKNRHADFGSGPRKNQVYGDDHRNRSDQGNYDAGGGRWPTNVVLSHGVHCGELCEPDCPFDRLGEPARFFPSFRYNVKASPKERPKVDGRTHPTVKPLALVRWLLTLVTPPGGRVLDPFVGSGTTFEAAGDQFDVTGIEREASYLPLIQARLDRMRAS